ncbi:MAG: hypothetical protein Q7S36_03550, partial [Candidatus Liptonbacteria bacterium]|nr:hypothetical protein [Candidatus Liptonbacteria bacterium]
EQTEYIFLSKSDLLDEKGIAEKLKMLKKIKKDVVPISIADENSLKKVKVILNKIADEKKEKASILNS